MAILSRKCACQKGSEFIKQLDALGNKSRRKGGGPNSHGILQRWRTIGNVSASL